MEMDDLRQVGGRILYSPADDRHDMPCLYAVVGDSRTLMVDGGVSTRHAAAFVESVRRRTGRGVDFAAVTHWHWDHTFGLAGIGAPVIACRNTAAHLGRMAGYGWSDGELDERLRTGEEIFFCAKHIKKLFPGEARGEITIRMPDIVFDGGLSLDLGGVTCCLKPVPTSHTDDCVAVWVREEGALMLGDAIGPDFYAKPVHYGIAETLELFRFIGGLSPRTVLQSHSEPETMDAFLWESGILLEAATALREGLVDREALTRRLKEAFGHISDDETDETVSLFLNGLR